MGLPVWKPQKRRSNADGSSNRPGRPGTRQIVLLLIEAKTRRFQFLDLHFAADTRTSCGTVDDVLQQIPNLHLPAGYVAPPHTYQGVLGPDGRVHGRWVTLKEALPRRHKGDKDGMHRKKKDLFLAIPHENSPLEWSQRAKHILKDGKVARTLSSIGIDTMAWIAATSVLGLTTTMVMAPTTSHSSMTAPLSSSRNNNSAATKLPQHQRLLSPTAATF